MKTTTIEIEIRITKNRNSVVITTETKIKTELKEKDNKKKMVRVFKKKTEMSAKCQSRYSLAYIHDLSKQYFYSELS